MACALGERVGVPWLGHTCGICALLPWRPREPLRHARSSRATRATAASRRTSIADARLRIRSRSRSTTVDARAAALRRTDRLALAADGGRGPRIGIYGFGAAAHIVAQVAIWQGREIFAFTRPGDSAAQGFARELGAAWAGGSDEPPPEPLDAAIIFAPVGGWFRLRSGAVRKGGRVVCGGIHMSDIPQCPIACSGRNASLLSVANLTRRDAEVFFPIARQAGVRTHTRTYKLEDANTALGDLRAGRLTGAAVLVP